MSDAKKSLDGRFFFDFGEKKYFLPKRNKNSNLSSKFSVFAFLESFYKIAILFKISKKLR